MPGSFTLGLVLLFVYIYLPSTVNKLAFSFQVPLAKYELDFGKQLLLFYFPTAVFLFLAAIPLLVSGYDVKWELLQAALAPPLPGFDPLYVYREFWLANGIYYAGIISLSCICGWTSGYFLDQNVRVNDSSPNAFVKFILGSIEPWYILLAEAQRRFGPETTIRVDVMTKSNRLYGGDLERRVYFPNGELAGFVLADAGRYFNSDGTSNKMKKPIPGRKMYFFCHDISNLNFQFIYRRASKKEDTSQFMVNILDRDKFTKDLSEILKAKFEEIQKKHNPGAQEQSGKKRDES